MSPQSRFVCIPLMMLLLTAAASATDDVTWVNASGGSWSTGANWNTGTPPTAADTAILPVLSGAYTVTLNGTHNITALRIEAADAALWIQAASAIGSAVLNVATTADNSGIIRLESASNNSGHSSNLTVGTTLTNAATGQILVRRGGGAVTSSTFTGSIANSGLIDVGAVMTLVIESTSGTFTQSAGSIAVDPNAKFRYRHGQFNFTGGAISGPAFCSSNASLNIAATVGTPSTIRTEESVTLLSNLSPAVTIWVNPTSAVGGATLVVSQPDAFNAGTINLESSSNNSGHNSNLSITGALTSAGTIHAQRGGGAAAGSSLTGHLVNQGIVSASDSRLLFTGTFEAAGGTNSGNVFIRASQISTTAPASGATTLQLEGANALTSDVQSGYELWVQANGVVGDATLSLNGAITNSGIIRLESTSNNSGHITNLASLGDFANAAGGQILIRRGGGATTFANLSGDITNEGIIDIGPFLTATHDGTDDSFYMLDGALHTDDTSKFRYVAGQFVFSGGEISGPTYCSQGSTLQIEDTVASDSTIRTEQSVTLINNAAQSVRVWVCGNAALGSATLITAPGATNAGTIWLESISNNSGHVSNLNTTGALTNSGLIFAQRGSGAPAASVVSGIVVNQGEVAATDSRMTCVGAFEAAGGVNNGAVWIRNAELRVTAPASSATILALEGSTTLTTSVHPGYELWVQPNGTLGNAALTVADGVSNHGTIRLESTSNNGGHVASLETIGAFTNAADGQITVRRGSGSTASANFSGSVINLGSIDFGAEMTVTHQAGGDVFDQAAGTFHVDDAAKYRFLDGSFVFDGGTISGPAYCSQGSTLQINNTVATNSTIRTEQAVTLLGNASPMARVWVCGNSSIGSATLSTVPDALNAGTIWLESISNNGGHPSNLVINGTFTNSGLILAQRGGAPADSTISGWLINAGEVAATTSRLTCIGVFEAAGGINNGSVFVRNAEVRVSAPASSATVIQIEGMLNTLVTSNEPGYELWVQGNSLIGPATLAVIDGAFNRGVIRLESTSNNGGHPSNLTLVGSLTNSAGARIAARRGGTPSGSTMSGQLTNLGTLEVGANMTLSHNGALTNVSANVVTDGSFLLSGAYRSPHGTITTNRATITFDGAGAAWNTNTNSNAFAAFATNDDVGRLTITNGKQFSTSAELHNRGRMEIGPGAACSPTAGFVMDDVVGATCVAQLGGVGQSNYARITTSGVATLRKTLRLELVNGFSPSNGDLFDIISCAARSGEFTTVERPAFSPDLQLDVLYYPTRVRIATVRPACSGYLAGDANCDGEVNNFDIDPFVLALSDSVLYDVVYPDCDIICNCDANGDDAVNNFDINAFVRLLSGG